MAVASLVLGIISIIIGAVSGGLVCSIIGLVLSLILYIACIGCTAGLASLY